MRNLWRWEPGINSLLKEDILNLLRAAPQILIGYSGGLDSTVLLHQLAYHDFIFNKLEVVHIHHGLSPNADHWQQHAKNFCGSLGLKLKTYQVAINSQTHVEASAREARYAIFTSLLREQGYLALAHHQDDQAETVLMHLCRGAGLDGLAGMPQCRMLGKGYLLRPFLDLTKQQLEAYAIKNQLIWISDESNENQKFSRNYIRHTVIPLLQNRWPQAISAMNTAAVHCQTAERNLRDLALIDCPRLEEEDIDLSSLSHLTQARLNNVLYHWLLANDVSVINSSVLNILKDEIIAAAEDADPILRLQDRQIRRYRKTLYCLKLQKEPRLDSFLWDDFPKPVLWRGKQLNVKESSEGLLIPEGGKVEVRSRAGGETIRFHGQTKSLKKLYQMFGIPPWLRDKIPLIYVNGVLMAVGRIIYADQNATENNGQRYDIDYERTKEDAI